MFSHVVLFWTQPDQPEAVDSLLEGARQYLSGIPGILHFHVGRMASSPRPVVDQTYQVGLNVVFESRDMHDRYQAHPSHLEFVEKVFRPCCHRVLVYDFEA